VCAKTNHFAPIRSFSRGGKASDAHFAPAAAKFFPAVNYSARASSVRMSMVTNAWSIGARALDRQLAEWRRSPHSIGISAAG